MYKKITLFTLFFSVLGLICQILIKVYYKSFDDYNYTLFYLIDNLRLNLSSGSRILRIDGVYWTLFFNFLLLVGGVLYFKSKEKETRLLRFLFSALFVQYSIYFLLGLCRTPFFISVMKFKDIVLYCFSLLFSVFILYFLYKSILYLNKLKALDFETFVYTESTEISYFKTSNWQRLLHLIIDSLLFAFIVLQLLDHVLLYPKLREVFNNIQLQIGERTFLMLLVGIFRTIFYFAFEALFSGSPAKFLTESRVVVYDEGARPGAATIFKRSLCRSIPFDSVSFLFKSDWHDTFSNTEVCEEKRTGIKGGWYLLLIPIFVILCFSFEAWQDLRERNQYFEARQKEFDENKSDILAAIKTLDTTSVLLLTGDDYSSKVLYLKVEKIVNNEIEFSVLHFADEGSGHNQSFAEKAYTQSKDTLKRIKVRRADLKKLLLAKLKTSSYETETFEGIKSIPQLKNQYIKNTFQFNSPQLNVASFGRQEKSFSLNLLNSGVPAEIIAIESNDEDVDWKKLNRLPLALPRDESNTLQAEGRDFEDCTVRITIKDSLNRKSTYEITKQAEASDAKIRLIRKP